MFSRFSCLIGENNFSRFKKLKIAIIGVGGVGSICALSLARSGIEYIAICDFDVVEESNINRQFIANVNNIGGSKVVVLKEMILEINPNCEVLVFNKPFNDYNNFLEKFDFDYVVDAIDDLENKFFLINYLLENKIKFISSMGMAKKLDPFKIEITRFSKTAYDPVARILRAKFKKENLNVDFDVVSSFEEIKTKNMGSYVNVTAFAGLLLAHYIIKKEVNDDFK